MAERPQQAVIVVDLGFGDAGKGTIIDYLARQRQAHTVVRFNGGAQAAHNVITPDGRHHTFAQFGSGSFVPGVRTYLSRFMLVDPYALFNEEAHLCRLGVYDAFPRMALDRRALIITPFQQAANRLKELARGEARHGSCGMGIGETVSDSLRYPDQALLAGDLPDRARVLRKLRFVRELKRGEIQAALNALRGLEAAQSDLLVFNDPELIEIVADNYAHLATLVRLVDDSFLRAVLHEPGVILFEGAQGVLLDESYGFQPYTTWSDCTFANASALLQPGEYAGQVTRLGVLRAYATRHGAGPFVTEDTALTAALPDRHNVNSPWQQAFRVGHFDLVAARYALEVAGQVDSLAITHLDRIAGLPAWKIGTAYAYAGSEDRLADFFAMERDAITRIKVRRPADLGHQEALTRRLWDCAPRYQPFDPGQGIGQYLAWLGQALGVPISLTSSGPTARDKRESLPTY